MADEARVLGVKIEVDASSVQRAKTDFTAAFRDMASASRAPFQELQAQSSALIAKSQEIAKERRDSINKIKQLDQEQAASAKQASVNITQAYHSIIGEIALITAATYTIIKAFEAMKQAAEFRGMVQASQNMARAYGANMQAVFNELDRVSDRTLTASAKFQLFNRALLLGGSEVADKLPQLFEIAEASAIATGQDFETVFEKLLTGIERGSPRLIQQSKLYIDVSDVVQEYADANGVAVDAVDEHTKKMLVLQEVLAQGGKLVQVVGKEARDEADSFEQASKAASEFIAVMQQIPLVTGMVSGLTTGLAAAAQSAIILGAAISGSLTFFDSLLGISNKIAAYTKAFEDISTGKSVVTAWRDAAELFHAPTAGLAEASRLAKEAESKTWQRALPAMGVIPTKEQDVESVRQQNYQRAQAIEDDANAKRLSKLAEFETKRRELIVSAGEKILDEEEKFAQSIEDANTEHYNKLQDIAIDGIRKRDELRIKLDRDLEDSGLDLERALEDNQRESSNRKVEIEERYQDKLRSVQRKFEDEYFEAVKNRDAVALVSAVRSRARGIEDASRDRDRDASKESRDSEERNQNARRADQRRRQDAQRHYQQALADQRRAEAQAIADENAHYSNEMAALNRHHQERIDVIGRWLDSEIATARGKYSTMQSDAQAHYARMAQIVAQSLGGSYGGGESVNPVRGARGGYRRAAGGVDIVNSPTNFLAGDAGPEIAAFIPLGGPSMTLPQPLSMNHLVGGNVSHQVDMISAQGMRGMEARITNAVAQALRQMMR